jgi:hypothetical protein
MDTLPYRVRRSINGKDFGAGLMERIYDVAAAEAKVLRDMQELVSEIRRLTQHDPVSVEIGSLQLRVMRLSMAEDLNQIEFY